jgi:hypothetical protein
MKPFSFFLQVSLAVVSTSAPISVEKFDLHCHVTGVASPDHILPVAKELDSTSLKMISKYFKVGKLRCLELLKTPEKITSIQRDFLNQYGLLFVEFGPITECTTFSKCWFGMLSCGQMKLQSFLQEYDHHVKHFRFRDGLERSPYLPFRRRPAFLGWSMQSLNIQFRIVGPEVLFPEIVYSPVNNILLCHYTLTIPGSYRIEIIPREFYPGVLFKYTMKEKIEGYDLLGYKSLDPNVRVEAISHQMKSTPVFCDHTKTKQQNKPTPTLPHNIPTSLPFCSKGNHLGRYLRIPVESLKICGADKIFPLMKGLPRGNISGHQEATRLEREYIASDHADHERHLRDFLIQQYQNKSQPIEQRLLCQELLRHTDEHSSLCPLIVVNELHFVGDLMDTRHEIFAPYKCRYRFYSPHQVRSFFLFPSLTFCTLPVPQVTTYLKRLHRTTSYSIGDSLTRYLYSSIDTFLNISQLSLAEITRFTTEVIALYEVCSPLLALRSIFQTRESTVT